MIIKKIIQKPFGKYVVKNLPKDAEYTQHNVNNNEIYYSKSKQCYYEVIR